MIKSTSVNSQQHSGYMTRESDFVLEVEFINRDSSWDRIKPYQDFAPQTAEDDSVTNLTQRYTAYLLCISINEMMMSLQKPMADFPKLPCHTQAPLVTNSFI